MLIDFLLSSYALGFSHGEVRRLDPARLCEDPRGLSGTEVNALGLAFTLARQGCGIRIVSEVVQTQLVDNVLFDDFQGRWQWPSADLAIAFHDSTPLLTSEAPRKMVWHQTIQPLHSDRLPEESVDLYISATERNACLLGQLTGGKPWAVIPNGWDFGQYHAYTPIPGRMIYHTSPERGLHVLLRALPTIRARVPSAHLDIWCRMETAQGHHPQIWAEIEQGLEVCKDYITVHPNGGSRNQVLAALAQASVFAYPSEPPMPCEVMPMAVMEACATGVPVVTAPSDGFEAAFGNALVNTLEPPSAHLESFTRCVCAVLDEPRLGQECGYVGKKWAQRHTFAASAQRFLEVIGA